MTIKLAGPTTLCWFVKMDDNKRKALGVALAQIEKQFGKNTVMRLGDHTAEVIGAISRVL